MIKYIGELTFVIGFILSFILGNYCALKLCFDEIRESRETFEQGPLWKRFIYIFTIGLLHAFFVPIGLIFLIAIIVTTARNIIARESPPKLLDIFDKYHDYWKKYPWTCLSITVVGIISFPFMWLFISRTTGY